MSEPPLVINRAAGILRRSEGGYLRIAVLFHGGGVEYEALAEWMENHPGDPRALSLADGICDANRELLDAYLRYAETGRVLAAEEEQ